MNSQTAMDEKCRIDKWLWAARFFKTRALAAHEIDSGRVQMEGRNVKASAIVRVAAAIRLVQAGVPRTVVVKGLSNQRGPASVAQMLYEETAESQSQRAAIAESNRLSPEPAHSIQHGRPTKRDRRDLQKSWDGT
jgi:ribosome-associated heat shock protein Hsp15